MVTLLVISGNCVSGAMVRMPLPGRLNWITLAPPAALALRIAWRREPRPESLALVTVKVAARQYGAEPARRVETARQIGFERLMEFRTQLKSEKYLRILHGILKQNWRVGNRPNPTTAARDSPAWTFPRPVSDGSF